MAEEYKKTGYIRYPLLERNAERKQIWIPQLVFFLEMLVVAYVLSVNPSDVTIDTYGEGKKDFQSLSRTTFRK